MLFHQLQMKHAEAILLATGSEVVLRLKHKKHYLQKALMFQLFLCHHGISLKNKMQLIKNLYYRKHVTKRLAIEMGASLGWHSYVGFEGDVLAIDTVRCKCSGRNCYERIWFHCRKCCCESKSTLTIKRGS